MGAHEGQQLAPPVEIIVLSTGQVIPELPIDEEISIQTALRLLAQVIIEA